MTLHCDIEINGKNEHAGSLTGDTPDNCFFSYSPEYLLQADAMPISQNLPLQEKPFSPQATRCFFDGLLPEGFSRRTVAGLLHVEESDYPAILRGLGNECLGAVRLYTTDSKTTECSYKKLSETEVAQLAQEGAFKAAEIVADTHLSLTGASGKVGLYYDENDKNFYLPLGSAPSTHIVKQSHVRLDNIVVNEQLCLLTAKKLGIQIPESFIICPSLSEREHVLFVTKRYDRLFNTNPEKVNGHSVPLRLHQETFAQALGIPSECKYENNGDNYLEKCFNLIKNVSSDPLPDMIALWKIIIFDYLIGNTDNHIKNISLLYSPDLRSKRLAPAYDIVSTIVYDTTSRNMGIAINNKLALKEITRSDFEMQAEKAGLGRKRAMQIFDEMKSAITQALENTAEELADSGFTQAKEVAQRILAGGGIHAEN